MSIELLKVVLSTLTPITIAIIGYFLNKNLVLQRQSYEKNNVLLNKRIEIYSEMANSLNNIYCYVNDVGDYKELTPERVIKDKRLCDKLFHTYRSVWSRDVIESYKKFMDSSFLMFAQSGKDAKIKTVSIEKEQAAQKGKGLWKAEWKELITNERDDGVEKYSKKYFDLLDAFSVDLGFSVQSK